MHDQGIPQYLPNVALRATRGLAIQKRAFLPVGNLRRDFGQDVRFARKILRFYLTR